MPDKILIAEDNLDLLPALRRSFEQQEYKVFTARDGREAMRLFYSERPDLVILDIMMPNMDGWEVCRRVREMSQVPIIMLTAKSEQDDIVQGFGLGVDDYITKPFYLEELLARVRVALRRCRSGTVASEKMTYHDVHLSIDLEARQVSAAGEPVKLTPIEHKILTVLLRNRGRVVEFEQIFKSVWGLDYVDETGYVHTYVWRLRNKIEPDPKIPRYLLKQVGVGYRFNPQSD